MRKRTTDSPLVSIVTPSYNSADFIEAAIRSVEEQAYPHLEHIIVDGQSTDSTLEILGRYQPAVSWISEQDNGQADALNKGFRMAQGEIIGWLNADDTYQPGAIKEAVVWLQANPAVDLVYGNFNFIDEQGQIITPHTTPDFAPEKLLYGAIIPQAGMFFRRRIIDELGGVNPSLHYVLDWEFTLRIALNYRVARVEQTWGNFRIVRGTKSVQQPENFWPEMIAVFERLFSKETNRSCAAATRDENIDPHPSLRDSLPLTGGGLGRRLFSEETTAQLEAWKDDALFMANLLAGLEFARVNQIAQAQDYVDRAFELYRRQKNHPAVLAAGLFKTAMHPWHTAFKSHPEAEQTLDNLSRCLDSSVDKRRLLGYLHLLRALKLLRRRQRILARDFFSQASAILTSRDLLDWRSTRMMLAAILTNSGFR